MSRPATAERPVALRDASDADGWAALFAAGGGEAGYRGAALLEARAGVRDGLASTRSSHLPTRAAILSAHRPGETMAGREHRSSGVEPIEVMSVHSFSGDRLDRVEFIR